MSTLGNYFRKLKPEKTSNLKVVVLCVFTATTFWLLNALNKDNYTTSVNQPLELNYDQEEFMAVGNVPREVRIQINGNGWDLLKRHFKISVTPLEVFVEDPSQKPFLLASDIERQMAEHLTSTNLVDIAQDTLFYSIDRIVSRKIQIVPDTTSTTLAENHAYASAIALDPETVTVTGPISVIEQLEGKLYVDIADDNINENYSKLLPLKLTKEKQKFLSLDEETSQVSFKVIAFLENTVNLEIQKLYFPGNVTIDSTITEIQARFLVQEDKMGALQNLELKAILNYNNRNREDSTISASLNKSPDYIKEVSFEPENFKLIYE